MHTLILCLLYIAYRNDINVEIKKPSRQKDGEC